MLKTLLPFLTRTEYLLPEITERSQCGLRLRQPPAPQPPDGDAQPKPPRPCASATCQSGSNSLSTTPRLPSYNLPLRPIRHVRRLVENARAPTRGTLRLTLRAQRVSSSPRLLPCFMTPTSDTQKSHACWSRFRHRTYVGSCLGQDGSILGAALSPLRMQTVVHVAVLRSAILSSTSHLPLARASQPATRGRLPSRPSTSQPHQCRWTGTGHFVGARPPIWLRGGLPTSSWRSPAPRTCQLPWPPL